MHPYRSISIKGRVQIRTAFLSLLTTQLCLGGSTVAASDMVNEYLDLDITQLMDISITSVSKKAQPLADAAAAIFVITQEDIRRSGVTTIPEALAMAPGLHVARISSSSWSVSARGFGGYTSNKLLVLMDGRSLYSPIYSGIFWDVPNTLLEDIDRIEVIRGPGATMWGANAVNGVVNIITKKAEDTQGGLLRLGGGDQERVTAGARYGGKVSDTAFGRIYLSYNDHAGNVLKDSDVDAYDSWQPVQGGFRLDGKPKATSEWTLQGDLYQIDKEQITFPYWTTTPPYISAQKSSADLEGGNLLGRWRETLASGDVLTLQAYYDRTSRMENYFQFSHDTVDFDLQYETRLGQWQNLTMGTGYRYVAIDLENTFMLAIPDHDDSLFNAFVQDEIGLVPDVLSLTLGTKYEQNDYSGSEWQPSAKLLWRPGGDHSFWASVARAVRTPTALDQEGRVVIGLVETPAGIGTVALTGSKDFESEVVIAYEAGTRWQANRALSFDLSLFYNDYSKLYTVNPQASPLGYDLVFVNGMEGESQGVELTANWKATPWWSLIFTYSYLTMDMTLDDQTGITSMMDYFSNGSPRHQGSVRSSFILSQDWQLNLWLRYVDDIIGLDSTDLVSSTIDIDSYFLLDANIIWTPMKNVEVMLAGQNLLTGKQLQYTAEVVVPPTEIERGIYGKITWRF